MVKTIHFEGIPPEEKKKYDALNDYLSENGQNMGIGHGLIFHYKSSTVRLADKGYDSEFFWKGFDLMVGSDEESQEIEIINELEKIAVGEKVPE